MYSPHDLKNATELLTHTTETPCCKGHYLKLKQLQTKIK